MDDDLDELFGDAAPLQLPEPLPKGLSQRIDELSLGGCSQRLTWSKNGCIAYISQDGRNVILHHLMCDPRDGQWRMSKEYYIDGVSTVHNDHPIVHICWGHTGTELAIVDVFGQISIYNVFLAINRLNFVKRFASDPEDNLSAVVGLMWVYSDRWGFFHQPMQKTAAEGWVFKLSQRRLLGPHNGTQHGLQRPALIAITRSGVIRILAQGQNNQWQEFTTEIQTTSSPTELLTHAAMCPEKIADKSTQEQESAILVATYNSDKELRIHRMNVDFERSSIDVNHVKTIDQCSPLDGTYGATGVNGGTLPSHAQLSLFEFIPPGPKSGTRDLTSPFLLASFSYLLVNLENGSTQTSQSTAICKWELQIASPELHPSLDSLSSKKANSLSSHDLPGECLLKRSSDVLVPKTLLAIHQFNMSTILVMLYSDGTVEYRDRTSMQMLPQDSTNQFSTLGQIGFNGVLKRSCLHTAISPNLCAAAFLDEQHALSLSLMHIEIENFFNESILEVVNEAFVMQGSLAAMNLPSYNDDLVATMQQFSHQHLYEGVDPATSPMLAEVDLFKSHFLSEVYRVLGLQYDYSVDAHPQQIIQNQVMQKCLATQASLGYAGRSGHPSLPSIVAQATLDLRHAAYSHMYASRAKPGSDGELKNPDSVHFIIGLVSWLMALFGFIVDEIFTLADFLEDEGSNPSKLLDLINRKVRDSNSPALPLLLISSSRTLLRLNCAQMRSLIGLIKAQAGPSPIGLAYRELEAVFQKSPITVQQFEHLLSYLDNNIKSTYQNAGLHYDDVDQHKREKEERNNIEKAMLIKATIPSVLEGPIKELLTTTVNALKEEVNVAELYFTDIGWLGLSDDNSSKRWREKHPMDSVRKTPLKKDARTKRCTRCGALTEDALPVKGANMMVMTLLRYCICGSWFMIGEEEGMADVQGENTGF